ncbi:hypothetical protein [Roseateles asaccharophilus]|uniref:Secreted protein n=1 Tax=Roseateles asaccharophilus TaxID=582607 RepID=A0ABU2A885_9BURK|nr:hypothetical protein [Roseateles asaccharophilus]MDR7332818.1 hypothetical protein [Roseateles asaccharophilus]
MSASRWALILLVALAGVAAFLFATQPPDTEPDATIPEHHVAASGPLQARAPVDTAATTQPLAVMARPALPAPLAAAARRIGSEGYGPHIDRAQVGDDAAAAWEAVQWLRGCASNEARRRSAEAARNQGVAPDMLTQLMVEADAEARRCQTVTAQHRLLLPELAARALRAGVPDAASAYAGAAFAGDLAPPQRQQVADALRRDARDGHAPSLLAAAQAHEGWGLDDTERLAYMTAYAELPGEPQARDRVRQLIEQQRIRFKSLPTPEQQAAARLQADQILARVRAGKPS